MNPTAGAYVSPVESSMNTLQAMLRELGRDSHLYRGMLRWSFHKNMENRPSNSVSLISGLVKELEEAASTDCRMNIIPLLHTLSYVVVQSGHIPNSLFQRMYDCYRGLLTLPLPYCTVALSNLRSLKLEMTTPGALYQRRAIAEQNLKNDHFTLQEKWFVFADPVLFSGRLAAAMKADLETGRTTPWTTATHERTIVLHTLQTGLGTTCQSLPLAHALEVLEDDLVQRYFQEVILAVQHSIERGASCPGHYQSTLQRIYSDILTAAKKEEVTEISDKMGDQASRCSTLLPTPEIHFLLWNNEEELWNTLVRCAQGDRLSTNSVGNRADGRDSWDSGIGTDLKDLSMYDNDEQEPDIRSTKQLDIQALVRDRIHTAPSRIPVLKDERSYTAKVVVMGDDRVLGRLAKAYHSIREKDSRRLFLTKKVNLQMYYIPVTDDDSALCSPENTSQSDKLCLASLLGRIDPWYNSNIKTLGSVIPKLAEMRPDQCCHSGQHLFVPDVLSYYLRCGTHPVPLALYSVKITLTNGANPEELEDVFVSHLLVDFPEYIDANKTTKGGHSSRRKSSIVKTGAVIAVSFKKVPQSKREVARGMLYEACGITVSTVSSTKTGGLDSLTVNIDSMNHSGCIEVRTRNIEIEILERTFTICLDKDSRRTYRNVQSIKICPCLDPAFIDKDGDGMDLSKYLPLGLSLPINTFSGITH